MTNTIVATEEILSSIYLGKNTAKLIADDLCISEHTARRHATLLVERGWAWTTRSTSGLIHYNVSIRGHIAIRNLESF